MKPVPSPLRGEGRVGVIFEIPGVKSAEYFFQFLPKPFHRK